MKEKILVVLCGKRHTGKTKWAMNFAQRTDDAVLCEGDRVIDNYITEVVNPLLHDDIHKYIILDFNSNNTKENRKELLSKLDFSVKTRYRMIAVYFDKESSDPYPLEEPRFDEGYNEIWREYE